LSSVKEIEIGKIFKVCSDKTGNFGEYAKSTFPNAVSAYI